MAALRTSVFVSVSNDVLLKMKVCVKKNRLTLIFYNQCNQYFETNGMPAIIKFRPVEKKIRD